MKESAIKLLEECNGKGITLTLDNGQLRYKAPTGVMDENLKAQLKAHKPELVELLSSGFNKHIQGVIAELNYNGVSMMDVPEATRHRAYELELELTKAANDGDQEQFLTLLKQWRECFH